MSLVGNSLYTVCLYVTDTVIIKVHSSVFVVSHFSLVVVFI